MESFLKIKTFNTNQLDVLQHAQFHSSVRQLINTIGLSKLNIVPDLYKEYYNNCDIEMKLSREVIKKSDQIPVTATLQIVRIDTDLCFTNIVELVNSTYKRCRDMDDREVLEGFIYRVNDVINQTIVKCIQKSHDNENSSSKKCMFKNI